MLSDPARFAGTAHTITGPESLDYDQVAQILSEATGREITYAKPGFLRYRRYYIKHRGLDKAYVNVTVALYFMTRMGTAQRVSPEFKQLTGREPRTFREFVKDNLDCFTL